MNVLTKRQMYLYIYMYICLKSSGRERKKKIKQKKIIIKLTSKALIPKHLQFSSLYIFKHAVFEDCAI